MNAGDEIVPLEASPWGCLLEKLHVFDQQTGPAGLYGSSDRSIESSPHAPVQFTWEHLLKPTMKSLGCHPGGMAFGNRKAGNYTFQYPAPIGKLQVVRISKIKVRKYGNAYRLDPAHEFDQRWEKVDVRSSLEDLREFRGLQGGLLLFIGFADEQEPFAAELCKLQSTVTFRRNFRPAQTKVWDDPHGRGFKVIAALWQVP